MASWTDPPLPLTETDILTAVRLASRVEGRVFGALTEGDSGVRASSDAGLFQRADRREASAVGNEADPASPSVNAPAEALSEEAAQLSSASRLVRADQFEDNPASASSLRDSAA